MNIFLVYFLIVFLPITISAQTLNPFYNNIVNNVNQNTLIDNLRNFESLGIKATPSSALNNTASWILSKLSDYGYLTIEENNFQYQNETLKNIIVTKTGTSFPDTYLIICGHYDTDTGPGANDNGTGVSIIIEVARLLKNIPTHYSIKFIFFAGEEEGYLGSRYFADSVAVIQNMDIRLVFNIDEVGGVAGIENNIIKCERDLAPPFSNNEASNAFTDTLSNLVQLYSTLGTEISYAYGSDYVPFQQNNYVITGLFENNQSDFVHTLNDSLSNLDTNYVFQIAKASVGALLFFSKAYENTSDFKNENSSNNLIHIFPNPTKTSVHFSAEKMYENLTFKLFDAKGNIIIKRNVDVPGKIDIPADINKTMYSYSLTNYSGKIFQTGKILIE